ncbi:hypothetical protein MSAN_01873400 [Mycena sanguinolenta]|uniref:Uncharacterized protein n=1 Tax=Mycena sanguinolenta TaxID=230812 RepID=A0A8H6XTH9_9AGAR|nr:hypothetical protein MSAN_01873400 [Mycena sanguinolenta]
MQYTVDSEAFDSWWYAIENGFSQTAVSLVLYGAYVNLFLLSLYTLSRRKTAGTRLLIAASCMMAVVGSTQMALDVAAIVVATRLFRQIVHSEGLAERSSLPALLTAQTVTLVVNYFIADSIFLYRCYVIWGSQKRTLILPSLLMSSNFVVMILGLTTEVLTSELAGRIATLLGVATTLVLTAQTAGRILWIQRAASRVALDITIRGRYTRAIVLILESGVVYCAAGIFLVITYSPGGETFSIYFGILQQLLNIVPTFTLVYIGLNNMAASSLEIDPSKFIAHEHLGAGWRTGSL